MRAFSRYGTAIFGLVAAALLLFPAWGAGAQAGASGEPCEPAQPDAGFNMLFDGTEESLEGWSQAGPGGFAHTDDCEMEAYGGMGLYWYEAEKLEEYTLKLDWKTEDIDDNSGVFLGFPDPGDDPWVAVDEGYEVQIYDNPDGYDPQKTGTIYDFQDPTAVNSNEPGEWNTYEITVDDPRITVELNGEVVNEFTSEDPERDLSEGYIGMQNHDDESAVRYRDVQVRELGDACPDPDLRETVTIGDRDTGVANAGAGDGCTINDLIDEGRSWESHGEFVSHAHSITDGLKEDGVIEDREKGDIMRAAGRSDVGKER